MADDNMTAEKWTWCMDYCKSINKSPADPEIWERAKQVYENEKNMPDDVRQFFNSML